MTPSQAPETRRIAITDTRLSPAQAALRLRCTPERVRQLFDTGILAGERTALGRLLDLSSVEDLIRSRNSEASPL